MERGAIFTSDDGMTKMQGTATDEHLAHPGGVVFVAGEEVFRPHDLRPGTLGILVDRDGEASETARRMIEAAVVTGWRATAMTLHRD